MPTVKALLTKMRCITETNEVGSDEPYVIVFAARLKKVAGSIQVPAAATTLYGPWQNVDSGDLVETGFRLGGKVVAEPQNFWGLNGKPQELNNLDEVIFIVGLMENDDADTGGIRAGCHAQMFAALTSYANSDMSRADMVKKLKKDMKDVLTGVMVTGLPNNDDFIGVAELRFPDNALTAAQSNTVVQNIELVGDGGRYRMRFEMKK